LILKVTLRSSTIVVSPFKTFMNFSGIALFLLRQLWNTVSPIYYKLYISWQPLIFYLNPIYHL
jgi:hypothetical protein